MKHVLSVVLVLIVIFLSSAAALYGGEEARFTTCNIDQCMSQCEISHNPYMSCGVLGADDDPIRCQHSVMMALSSCKSTCSMMCTRRNMM